VTRKSPTSTYSTEHGPQSEERMMDTATPPLTVDARHLVKRYRSKTAVDPGPLHPCAYPRNAVAQREETA